MFRQESRLIRVVLLVSVLASSALAVACQVPVFRYALERWSADQYRYVVLCEGELTKQQQQLADGLAGRGQAGESGPGGQAVVAGGAVAAALRVHRVTQQSEGFLQDLWRQREVREEPLLVCLFPRTAAVETAAPAFTCALNSQSVQRVQSSPVRRELTKRLQSGDSAVWLFLGSGQAERDQAAYERLVAGLQQQEGRLKLPTATEMEVTEQQLQQLKVPLKLSFSVLKVNRADPAEAFLVSCLLRSEEDLEGLSEPMAFPVFGRGRVLYALVGDGIAEGTITAACDFLAGPCSCQVKEQNPGFDLLLSGDWERVLGDVLVSDPLPAAGAGKRTGNAPQLLAIPPGRKSGSGVNGGNGQP